MANLLPKAPAVKSGDLGSWFPMFHKKQDRQPARLAIHVEIISMTLKKIDHQFAYEQLSYDAKPNYQPYVKLTFYFSKLPHVSYEQFHRHWETVHADLTIATKDFRVHGLQRYVQFHQTPEAKEKVKAMGMDLMEVDGCSEIWVKSWDDWEKFYNSPEYAKSLGPDCGYFMAMPIKVMAGYDNIIFGKAVPDQGGKDGVQFD